MAKTSVYVKKLFGTSTLITAAASTVLIGAAVAGAQFIDNGNQLIFDGQVASISSSSIEVVTSATDPIIVQITNKTVFLPKNKTVMAGDDVHIIARKNDDDSLTARVIRNNGDKEGYGKGGQVVVRDGVVSEKGSNTFSIDTDITNMTFHVKPSTKFVHTNFATLHTGDHVQVIGHDNGSQFNAKIVIKKGNNHEDDDEGEIEGHGKNEKQGNNNQNDDDNQGNDGRNFGNGPG